MFPSFPVVMHISKQFLFKFSKNRPLSRFFHIVAMSVRCIWFFCPLPVQFFSKASHWPSDHMIRSVTINAVSEIRRSRSFTPGDYSRQRTGGWPSPGWARRRPDQREAEEGEQVKTGRNKIPASHFSLWLLSNPGDNILFLLKFNEARIS